MGTSFFFFNDTATTEIYTLSLHDALPISRERRRSHAEPQPLPPARPVGARGRPPRRPPARRRRRPRARDREEHTSELQSPDHLVCRLLLEKKTMNIDSLGLADNDVPPQRV